MTKIDEAEILVKVGEAIKIKAEDFDYKPGDDALPLSIAVQYAFEKGQRELIDIMIDRNIVSVYDLRKIYDYDEEQG